MSIQQEPEIQAQARFLALDTSTTSLAVSVIENDKVLHEINAYGVRNHSVRILSIIEEALKVSNTTNTQVQGIAVGIGPGSYTGTRIAVTAAKTLAWAWEIPVVGISSLHALAYGGYTHGMNKLAEDSDKDNKVRSSWIIPLLDARRGQVFTALFSMDHEEHIPNRLEQDGIRLMETWVEQLISLIETLKVEDRPDSVWIVGDVSLHAEAAMKLSSLLGDHLHIVPYDLEGRFVGILGADRLLKGDMDDMHALVPNYTQLAEAEANLLRALKEGR